MNYFQTNVSFNGDFYYTESQVQPGMMRNPNGKQFYLLPDSGNFDLGQAVSEALFGCIELKMHGVEFAKYAEENTERYLEWVDSLLSKYGYKNKTAVFKNMIVCTVTAQDGLIKISPTNHDRLDAWGGILDDGLVGVEIPIDSAPEALGRAVRVALSRCLNPYGLKRGLAPHNFDSYI